MIVRTMRCGFGLRRTTISSLYRPLGAVLGTRSRSRFGCAPIARRSDATVRDPRSSRTRTGAAFERSMRTKTTREPRRPVALTRSDWTTAATVTAGGVGELVVVVVDVVVPAVVELVVPVGDVVVDVEVVVLDGDVVAVEDVEVVVDDGATVKVPFIS